MTGGSLARHGPRAARPAARNQSRNWPLIAGLAIAFALAVLVIGGYGLHWRWTGLSDSVTLWDWLQALALPLALATAPILLRHRHRLASWHRGSLFALAVVFAGLVLAGYLVPLGWTGFTGNTLWDWLSLLLLPAVVATASIWGSRWPPTRRQRIVVAAVTLALIAVALPGYLEPWRWTGFVDNTAWDWVKLLLLPVLLPIAVIPLTTRYFSQRLAPSDEPDRAAVGSAAHSSSDGQAGGGPSG